MSTQYDARPDADQPRGRKRKTATVAGLIAAAVAGAGGVALAAILLTTNINGTATVKEINTSNDVKASITAVNGTQLDCSDVKVSADNKTLTFNPILTKVKTGQNATGAPVPGGDCTLTVSVTNTGNTALKLDPTSDFTAPNGWTISDLGGAALGGIAPGATATASAKVTATDLAETGAIGGRLVYTDAA